MSTKPRPGLAAQFLRLLLLSWLASFLLLGLLQIVMFQGLRSYYDQPEVQQRATQKQIDEFQAYIDENHLSSRDFKSINAWVKKRQYNLLELYRGQTLIYSSYASQNHFKDAPHYESDEQTADTPRADFADWAPAYTLTFSDGKVTALLYYNALVAWYNSGWSVILTLIRLASFPLFFVWGSRHIVNYIILLSEEVQAMESGDLDHPITIKGRGELTTLASCLDSMRLTLRQQHEDEAAASAKVKNLITEMSHDLRTPLTTLLLYTEILRHHKYETPAQAEDYLEKIDTKARQRSEEHTSELQSQR